MEAFRSRKLCYQGDFNWKLIASAKYESEIVGGQKFGIFQLFDPLFDPPLTVFSVTFRFRTIQ